jgi:hypothetical protein
MSTPKPLKRVKKHGTYVLNDSFVALRRALFERAARHDAHEAAYALLYQDDTYGMQRSRKHPGLTDDEWWAIAACDDALLWKTMARSALYGRNNESVCQTVARMAIPDLESFHETVRCWGTQLLQPSVMRLWELQADWRPTPTFAGFAWILEDEVATDVERSLQHQSWEQRRNNVFPKVPEVVALPDGALTDAGDVDWTIRGLESWRELAQGYARYCFGSQGRASFPTGKVAEQLQAAPYVHLAECSYKGAVLFYLVLDATYQRLHWFERVVTPETRKLKRSLGGHIGLVRRATRQLGEFAMDEAYD